LGAIVEDESQKAGIRDLRATLGPDTEEDEEELAFQVEKPVSDRVAVDLTNVNLVNYEPSRPYTHGSKQRPSLRHDHLRGSLEGFVTNLGDPDKLVDWRFLTADSYLDLKEKALKTGRKDLLRKLLQCLNLGTVQACQYGGYPILSAGPQSVLPKGEIAALWDELWRLRHELPRMSWFTNSNARVAPNMEYEPCGQGNLEPPMTCVFGHPLDVAVRIEKHLRDNGYADRPQIIVHFVAMFEKSNTSDDTLKQKSVHTATLVSNSLGKLCDFMLCFFIPVQQVANAAAPC